MKTIFEFLLKLVGKALSYSDFAEVVLKVAKVFFNNIAQFIQELVDEMDDEIAAGTKTPGPTGTAIEHVVTETVNTFAGSPSYVPAGIVRIIAEATVYQKHHGKEDVRNRWAHEHNFFRSLDKEELKDVVERLNKGFGNA